MTDDSKIKLRDIGEDAAAWVVRMASDQRTQLDEDGFREWLAASPDNAEAYADHELIWTALGDIGQDGEAREILRSSQDRSVSAGIAESANDDRPAAERWRPSRRAALGGAGALAASVAAAMLVPDWLSGIQNYETAPGEQRTLMLADGSEVTLNTNSALRVDLADHERRLYLDRGQVFFRVAKDAVRPFRVFAGEDEVRALGTAFDVRRKGNSVEVILEEGTVAIYRGAITDEMPGPATIVRDEASARTHKAGALVAPAAILQAGQRAQISPAATISLDRVDTRKTQAWRFGRMVLDETSLAAAVEDINRYGGRKILLSDPALGRLKVSGVFHTNSPDAFVDGVVGALPVEIASQTDTQITLAPAQ